MKVVCTICGFVYDETLGIPEAGIAPGTRFDELPDTWVCPVCGAPKAAFRPVEAAPEPVAAPAVEPAHAPREMSNLEVSAVCSNLARGCEKQYLAREAELFLQLANYYADRAAPAQQGDFESLTTLINSDLSATLPAARTASEAQADRGALRAVTWAEKVTTILLALIDRFAREPEVIKHTNVFVCEICGFVYAGLNAPEICPVCKVPGLKIAEIVRR